MKRAQLKLLIRNKWTEIVAMARAPPPPPPKDPKEVKAVVPDKISATIDSIAVANALASNPHNISRYEEVMPAFVIEISALHDMVKALNDTASRMATLHSRLLSSRSQIEDPEQPATDAPRSSTTTPPTKSLHEQLNDLSDRAKNICKDLCKGIKEREMRNAKLSALASSPAAVGMGPVFLMDEETRKGQTDTVKQAVLEALENWQGLEGDYKALYRGKIERRVKSVKPKAKPEEVRSVAEEGDGEAAFSEMLEKSDRLSEAESKIALLEVQDRRRDLKRISVILEILSKLIGDLNSPTPKLPLEATGKAGDRSRKSTDKIEKEAEKAAKLPDAPDKVDEKQVKDATGNDKGVVRRATLKSLRALTRKNSG